MFKEVFACRIVVSANHQYPGNFQSFFCLQICLSRKSSVSRKYLKTFSPAELSYQQVIDIPEIFKDFSRLQNCLSRKSSISRKYSKTFLPAEMSQPQIINIPEISKDFFACRIVLAANHQYPGNIQRLFGLQKRRSRKSSISRKYTKTSSPADLSQQQIIVFPKYSKTFSPAELSQPQIVSIPKILKSFFACRIVLAANPHYTEHIQSLFYLQNCLSHKSSKHRTYSKSFSPAELS